jgi:hypothetical protein
VAASPPPPPPPLKTPYAKVILSVSEESHSLTANNRDLHSLHFDRILARM